MESNLKSGTSGIHKIEKDTSDILNSCRVCMSRDNTMTNIFSEESSSIVERVLFCTGIHLTEESGLPTRMCETCVNNLTIAHKFKTSCVLADETLRKIRGSITIKTEVPESDELDGILDYDDDDDDKDELMKMLNLTEIKVSRLRPKKEKPDSTDIDKIPLKVHKKRGPYKKSGKPRRMLKMKYARLRCEACNIKFNNKMESDQHKKAVHKQADTWVCEICGKQFIHRASHYSHIRSHLPPQYACEHCDYKTWYKHDLTKHLRIHTGLKLYQCDICSNSYHTSSNLTSHIKRLHEGLKPFECPTCGRKFFDRTKLNRHLDSHNDVKRYECEVCHSCFTRRCYWKKHLERQHGVVIPAQRPGRQKLNMMIGELASRVTAITSTVSAINNCVSVNNGVDKVEIVT